MLCDLNGLCPKKAYLDAIEVYIYAYEMGFFWSLYSCFHKNWCYLVPSKFLVDNLELDKWPNKLPNSVRLFLEETKVQKETTYKLGAECLS